MIVWGGFGGSRGNDTIHNDGARYNPASDTWKPVTTKNAPSARLDFPAVWTGREMLVWGGFTDSHSRYQGYHADAHLNTGGRYDPAADSWKTITTQGAPSKRCEPHPGLDRQRNDRLGRRQRHQSPQRRRPLQSRPRFLEAGQHRRRAQPARGPRRRLDRQGNGRLGRHDPRNGHAKRSISRMAPVTTRRRIPGGPSQRSARRREGSLPPPSGPAPKWSSGAASTTPRPAGWAIPAATSAPAPATTRPPTPGPK